jgi:nucleoside-diphosphate-sugar epimerase
VWAAALRVAFAVVAVDPPEGKAVDRTVALVGASHPAARAMALALEAEPEVERVLGLASSEPPLLGPKFEYVRLRSRDRLAAQVEDAATVVVFPWLDAGARDQEGRGAAMLEDLDRLLDGIQARGGTRLVLWSSGVVYGAHDDNPVPLREQDPLRPPADFPPAGQLAELERRVLELHGPTPVVLRPAALWAPEWGTFLARALQAPALLGVRGTDPPVQALHPQDAAGALLLAARGSLRGVYNVAPADHVPASKAARLLRRRRIVLPEQPALAAAERLWDLGLAGGPPGALRYLAYPWVLDAGRLRTEGWTPTVSTAAALGEAGRQERAALVLGRLTLRKGDVYRGVGVGLATAAMMAVARRRVRRR